MAVTRQQVAELYVATFNRAPDADGLDYWVNLSGLSIEGIASSFFDQAETQALYPTGTTDTVFVTSIYTNLFNRAPDAAGLAYWEAELTSGNMTRSVMIEAMKNGALGADAAIIANKATVGLYYADAGLQGTDFSLASVTAFQSSVTAAQTSVDALTGTASFSLTTGIDTITGTAANEIIDATGTTFTALDTINGGAGTDTLNIVSVGVFDTTSLGVIVTGVETVNVRGALAVTLASNTWTGTTAVNVTQATAATVVAAATTDINVSGATGTIIVNGGKDISVTSSTADATTTIGGLAVNAGTITVNQTAAGDAAITVDGGTDVTITVAGSIDTGAGVVSVGQGGAATDLPSGALTISSSHTAVAATNATLSNILTDGGSTISVTQTATSSLAATDTTGSTVTMGGVNIGAGNATTSITASQTASTLEVVAVAAVAAVAATKTLTFSAMTTGQTLIIDGLTFTAAKALTAAEVAAAFAGLSASDKQDDGGVTANGIYTGNTSANWTSAAASGATVVFSEVVAGAIPALVVGGSATAATVVTSAAGTAATAAVTGVLGVINGQVLINDNATASVTTVTVDGYGDSSSIGVATTMAALTTVSLANSGGTAAGDQDATMDIDAAGVTTLTLNVDNIQGTVDIDEAADASITALTLNSTGTASTFGLQADGVTDLTIAATAALNVATGSTFTALTDVTVTGTAAVTLGDVSATLTSLSAAAASGAISASVDGDIATVATGAGDDTVTLLTTTVFDEDIDLGAGDDTLVLTADTTVLPTGTVDGGTGNDTISMTSTSALAYDNNTNFANAITSFERLVLSDRIDVDGDVTLDMEKLGFSYVTLAGGLDDSGATAETLILNNMANNGTVVLTNTMTASVAQSDLQVNVKDAATTTASLNIIANAEDALNVGSVTANDVESFTIAANDIDADELADGGVTLAMLGDAVTTITVTGDADLGLTTTAANLATLNASSLTGGLTYTVSVANLALTTGSGADIITASANGASISTGAGNDRITISDNVDLLTIDGGTGADTFIIGTSASSNKSNYAVFTNVDSGDTFDFEDGSTFNATEITLAQGATESTQAYLDQAMTTLADNGIGWFQYNGNTFIAVDQGGDSANSFVDGTDQVIMITGLIDLGTGASFNATTGTLEIA